MDNGFDWQKSLKSSQSKTTATNQAITPKVDNWMEDLQQSAQEFGMGSKYPSQPVSAADQVSALPNSEKLSPVEKWLYQKLPGFSQSKVGQALESFSMSPAGKLLSKLDLLAEGLERTLGMVAQFRDRNPDEEFRLKDAWTAGTLFYETANLPRFAYDESGWNVTGIQMDTEMPGAYAVTEARRLLQQGKPIEEIRDLMYSNMGALALRAQLQDTLGHIALDPLNWVLGAAKPVEKLHAIRNLAMTGKMDVATARMAEQAARAAGNIEDANKIAEAIATAEQSGKALNKLDKFAISMTGGVPWMQDVSKLTSKQKLIAKLNPFALTPQARASEMLDMVASNVGEYLVRPNWAKDPEEFIQAVAGASRGSIGGEWGHLASTLQGRTTQGILSNADGAVKQLGQEWKVYTGERSLLQRLSGVFDGMDERALWRMAKDSPDLLWKKVTEAAQQPGFEFIAQDIANGLTPKVIEEIGKIPNSVPLLKEEFYTKALVTIQDVAMRQSILQFGIKEKGVLTKWSDALKAWESLPFIKANPANAMRNVVNNDITLIGRGLFGTMSDAALKDFWKGKFIPQQFERGFGLGVEELAHGAANAFDPGNAAKALEEVLTGKQTVADTVKMAAGKVDLKAFDFSKWSSQAEKAASRRASTMGWLQFHQQYWNPRTGYTSVTKSLDPATLEQMEQAVPGITEVLDDIVQSAGTDSEKLAKLLQSEIDFNPATVFKNAEQALGYKLDDVLGSDIVHTLQDGLQDAIKNGTAREFVEGVRKQVETHIDEMFSKHVENLPGIVAAQVQAGGQMQFHRVFGKALDEFWAGNSEHAMRMSSINEVIDAAKESGDWGKVDHLWRRILNDSDAHFNRIWKKFDSYQAGLEQGAKQAGIKYPSEIRNSFKDMEKGWKEFYNFRNTEYQNFFDARLKGKEYSKTLERIQSEIQNRFKKMVDLEDQSYQHVDDLMAKSIPDKFMQKMYMNFRDKVADLRRVDKEKTVEFYDKLRRTPKGEAQDLWSQYWTERMSRVEQIRQMEMRGSAALQGDSQYINMFVKRPAEGETANDIFTLADQFGVSSATGKGARNNRRVLNTVNKYLPEGTEKFKKVEDIPLDVAQQAFVARADEMAAQVTKSVEKAFIPDAEQIFKDPMPIETGLSELTFGRGYAAMDAITEEAIATSSRKSMLLKELDPAIQEKVMQWSRKVEDEMSSFRAAGVQFAAFRRDSALLNYNRRTNFDNLVGHMAPFAFWTTHTVSNWMIHSLDRPAMLTSYFRSRQLFETAGLPDQNVPSRLKGNIRVKLPFTPDWMGDTFVNPMRFLLPFDGFMAPWEQAQANKFTMAGKTKDALNQMLESGMITEDEYNDAVSNQRGSAWEQAEQTVKEGGDNFDAMDFVNLTMTPHAPLMWAFNAARGTKQDIGPFTPMSRTAKNLATMMGVDDWSNSPYNIEGRVRKSMGLPAYDKWDDYRVGREISNIAASGKYGMNDIKEAMTIAAMVEAGKITSKDAVAQNKIYAEATKRSNQEAAGGWAGTVLGILGIPVRAYPTGEQQQRELAEQFKTAYTAYENGDVEALSKFFDKNPEYESRLALFKSPEERLKNFMIDNLWAKWNEMPKVQQDEVKEQMGGNFANFFLNKEMRNYDSLSPVQLQMYLKLMGGKPVGTLTADQEVLAEFNQLKLTDPETAWRVQTFYDMRKEEYPNFSELQNAYYKLPEGQKRSEYVKKNPQLKEYWDSRRKWMTQNPDLVRFLTDDEKQLAKYAKMQRNPEVAIPTAEEISQNLSPSMQELIADYANGEPLPPEMDGYLSQLAQRYNVSKTDLLRIVMARVP